MESDRRSYLTDLTFQQAKKVFDSTINWLEDFNGKRGNAALPLLPFQRLVEVSQLLFQLQRWDLRSILWVVKYTAGYVLLFCLSVYVPAWNNFGIGTNAALYSGWHMLSYAFAWMPTVEGTAKRAWLRFFGTLFGGFFAWIGIITCCLFYNRDGGIEEMNNVAVVIWITYNTLRYWSPTFQPITE